MFNNFDINEIRPPSPQLTVTIDEQQHPNGDKQTENSFYFVGDLNQQSRSSNLDNDQFIPISCIGQQRKRRWKLKVTSPKEPTPLHRPSSTDCSIPYKKHCTDELLPIKSDVLQEEEEVALLQPPVVSDDFSIRQYCCQFCTAQFACMMQAIHHFVDVHPEFHEPNKPFVCPVCLKQFPSKHRLKNHAKGHRNDRPFVCSFCQATFKLRQHLVQHMPVHSSVLPFVCGYCSRAFRTKQNMQQHVKNNHPSVGADFDGVESASIEKRSRRRDEWSESELDGDDEMYVDDVDLAELGII